MLVCCNGDFLFVTKELSIAKCCSVLEMARRGDHCTDLSDC